jgi:hypothetical protein
MDCWTTTTTLRRQEIDVFFVERHKSCIQAITRIHTLMTTSYLHVMGSWPTSMPMVNLMLRDREIAVDVVG